MRIDILTILPGAVEPYIDESIIGRARASGLVDLRVVDIREYARDRHRTTDDTPCGGGGGMIMKVEPVADALASTGAAGDGVRVVLTDPAGRQFTQADARALATESRIVIVCGRYEGVDDRVRSCLATDVFSIGDYVLTGGELPALAMADAVIRLLPGALGDQHAPDNDSFAGALLEYPQFTRPREYAGVEVPCVLMDGHRSRIAQWQRRQQLQRTRALRPDLWSRFVPTLDDLSLLAEARQA